MIRRVTIIHWTSYEKIAESPNQWNLDEAEYRTLEKMQWVVTEKIHGANFCIITNGSTIVVANRKHLLAADDSFFEYQRVLQRVEQHIYQLFQLFISDILEQLDINQPTLFASLTKAERTQLIASIQQETRTLFKHYFQQETRRI